MKKSTLSKIFLVVSGLLLAPHYMAATAPASAETTSYGMKTEAHTIRELLAKSSEERTKIVFTKLVTLMNNLGSLTDSRGNPKPPEMIRAHQKMFDILDERFFNNHDKVLDDGFTSFDRLWLDLELADPDASFGQVFMAHVRKVVAEYERNQKGVPQPETFSR